MNWQGKTLNVTRDEVLYFMKQAYKAAEKARGKCSPNPFVGAVVVKKGKVVATGWTQSYGGDHAEVHALKIDNMDIVEELALPPVKIHCSVLAEDAIKSAIKDYKTKNALS